MNQQKNTKAGGPATKKSEEKSAAAASEDLVVIGDEKAATMKMASVARALSSGKGKVASFRTTMVQKFTWGPTAANTAYSTVQALTPMGSTEGGNFSTIFDEVKTVGVTVHFSTFTLSDGNTAAPQPTFGILGYDPSSTTALGSVAAGIEIAEKFGPFSLQTLLPVTINAPSGPAAGYVSVAPTQTTKTGLYMKKFKIMGKTVLNPGTSTEIVGGSWVSTQDSNQIVGYLKPYFEAAGAHMETGAIVWVEYHVIFRSRH